jgi:site-specific recombinase XerD
MPHVRKRGNSYGAILQVDGQRKHVSITAEELTRRDLTTAEWVDAEMKDYRNEVERVALGLPGPMRLSALFQDFEDHHLPGLAANTQKTYGASLDRFRAFFTGNNDIRADKVQTAHVMAFVSWRRSERGGAVGGRTIAKDRTVLHTVFEHGIALGVMDRNPVTKKTRIKHDSRDPYILEAAELEKLMGAAKDHPMLAIYILTLHETGLRSESEGLWLRWTDLDFDYEWTDRAENVVGRGRIVVRSDKKHRTKTGRGRIVPMTPRLRRALMEHRMAFAGKLYGAQPSPWVFCHEFNRRRAVAGTRIGSLRRAFDAAVVRAKLPTRINQHDLRHTRATTWLADGKPAHVVQQAMGHSSIRTTMGYYRFMPTHLRALVDPEAQPVNAAVDIGG